VVCVRARHAAAPAPDVIFVKALLDEWGAETATTKGVDQRNFGVLIVSFLTRAYQLVLINRKMRPKSINTA
jgi:hypothetical protein